VWWSVMILILVIGIWIYTLWNGIEISIHSGKFKFDIEIYSLKRFFKKRR